MGDGTRSALQSARSLSDAASVDAELPTSASRVDPFRGRATDEAREAPVFHLSGRWVELRDIGPGDEQWLYRLAMHPEVAPRWRHLPGSVSPSQFTTLLWQGVLTQFIIRHKASNLPVGLVVAYQADMLNRHAHIAVVLDPAAQRRGSPIEGVFLFIRHLFRVYHLHKIYAEVVDFNLGQYASLMEKYFHREGLFRQHIITDFGRCDMHIIATYPRDWEEGIDVADPSRAR